MKAYLSLAAAVFITSIGCANTSENKVTETAPSSKTETLANSVARESDSSYFVDVEFKKGSHALTDQSRAAITSLMNRARMAGELEEVKVLAWSDEEYPTAQQKRLSASQRDLAKLRNRSIETHVESLKYEVDVDTHSMAERPSAVSRWLNTSDARFKRSLIAAGLPTTADEPIAGRASRAVVLVKLK